MDKKDKDSVEKKVGKKIVGMALLIFKPFIPFIIIFLFIFFFIVLIVDAIFVQLTDKDGKSKISESKIQEYCENAEGDFDVYVDGVKSNGSITIDGVEKQKSISWEQVYSIMVFHNITEDEEMTEELANNIASEFKSKYYYKTSKIITEQKVVDEDQNITWEVVNEETVTLITESITIAGHYIYNYETEVTEERRFKDNKGSS